MHIYWLFSYRCEKIRKSDVIGISRKLIKLCFWSCDISARNQDFFNAIKIETLLALFQFVFFDFRFQLSNKLEVNARILCRFCCFFFILASLNCQRVFLVMCKSRSNKIRTIFLCKCHSNFHLLSRLLLPPRYSIKAISAFYLPRIIGAKDWKRSIWFHHFTTFVHNFTASSCYAQLQREEKLKSFTARTLIYRRWSEWDGKT